MKAKRMQSVFLAAGLALSMPLHAENEQGPARNCDEIVQPSGNAAQDDKRDTRCIEQQPSKLEDGSLPVSGNMLRHREQTGNPGESPVATPAPSGKGGK